MSAPAPRPTVLLTGAAHGIGRATALALAAGGSRLALLDRDSGPLDEATVAARRAGSPQVEQATADVRDRDAVQDAVKRLMKGVGPIDVLVACAGIGNISNSIDLDTAGLRKILEVNVLGVAHAIEAVLPAMYARGRGHIVGLASVAAYRGMPWMPAYSASKAALANYLEGLRPGLKRRGVTITTVYPGFVATGLTAGTPFRKPVKMLTPEQAATHLVRAIERRPRDCVFPLSAALGMGLLRRLSGRAFDRVMDRIGPEALTGEF